MKKIKLDKNKYALVDDEDYDLLAKDKWYAHKKVHGEGFYARGLRHGTKKLVFMHRIILNTPSQMFTDHIDGNGLNNQKSNLRICTNSQNQYNKGKYKNNKSGYKGVSWSKSNKKWQATMTYNHKVIKLGLFKSKIAAYKKYCESCKECHGEFLNKNL